MPTKAKDEIALYMKFSQATKHAIQRNSQEMVDYGSYYHYKVGGENQTSMEHVSSCPTGVGSSRVVRGPMDRYIMVNNEDDKLIPPPHPK